MPTVKVGRTDEFEELRAKVVDVGGIEIGIIRTRDKFLAIRNQCPHKLSPICEGRISGTMLPSSPGERVYGMESKLLVCPSHGFEYDMDTGLSVFNGTKLRLKMYKTSVQDGSLYVTV